MAKKVISQRLALEGGEEIKAILQAIGKAGEQAFEAIGAAAAKASPQLARGFVASTERLKANLVELERASGRVQRAIGNLGGAFQRFGTSLSTVATRLGLVTTAAILAGGALLGIGKSAITAVDAADEQAQALGLTIEKYSALSAAASQSNATTEQFATGITRLNALIGKTGDGFGLTTEEIEKNTEKLTRLGIATRNTDGSLRATDEVLLDLADVFAKLPDGAEKAALALQFFGRSGPRLIPFLNQGRDGIRALTEDARRMGLVLTDADKRTAALGDKGLDRLSLAIQGARIQFGLLFAPAIGAGANFLADLIRDNIELIKAFGQTIVTQGTLLVADFIALLLGADDRVSNTWLITARDGIVAFGRAVINIVTGVIIPAFELLQAGAQAVADLVNRVFGTDFTASQVLAGAAVLKLTGILGLLSSSIGIVVGFANLLIAGFTILAPLWAVLTSGAAVFGRALLVIATGIAAILGLPVTVVAAIGAALVASAVLIYAYWDEITAAAEVAWAAMVASAAAARDLLVAAFSNPDASALRQIFDVFVAPFRLLQDAVNTIADGIAGAITTVIGGAVDFVIGRVNALISVLRDAIAAQSKVQSGGGGGGGSGFASGGYVRGPGGPTDDRIPAWLSNKEYVIRAAAVRKLGVGFLNMLNSGRYSLEEILQRLQGSMRFRDGGLVTAPRLAMPALAMSLAMPGFADPGFAAGGLVGEESPQGTGPVSTLNLTIGNETFAGLSGPVDVIERLDRAVRADKIRSIGRTSPYDGR